MSAEPTTIRTLEGSLTLWPDGLELAFSGINTWSGKKKASPVRVRLADLDHVELVAPRAVLPGALRLRLRQATPDAGKRPQRDPHSTTFTSGQPYDDVLAACRDLETRGVLVRGLPAQAPEAPAAPAAPTPAAPTPAAPAPLARPPRRPKTSLERLYTFQMWISGIQLFLLLLPVLIVAALIVLIVAVIL